ncbi:hypothetical protein [Streptomyces sp. NPDC007346]|uniref:hypothetical protein n=1 Tax=Streptomyces sp. NPDC007346 TaxID=3154682 RepID=UPI003455B34B
MTARILHASTPSAVTMLAAMADAGCFAEAGRRILLLSRTDGPAPETVPDPAESAGFARLRTRFDEVVSWNDAIFPFHPDGWLPRADDVPLWERHFRRAWGLGDEEVELVVESPHAGPAQSLTRIFAGVPIDVYADGPACYGPTGGRVPPLTGTRVRRLFHPDLVPGLRPLLLGEYGVEARAVPSAALLKVVAELADVPVELPEAEAPALLLGQRLAAPGLLSPAEAAEVRLDMVRGAVALGHTRLVFAPDPDGVVGGGAVPGGAVEGGAVPGGAVEGGAVEGGAVPGRSGGGGVVGGRSEGDVAAMAAEAARLGAELTVLDASVPVAAGVLLHRLRPALVVGCSSAALFTAAGPHGLPVATVGTGLLLERLAPYENAERVPATIADALLPGLRDAGSASGSAPGTEVGADTRTGSGSDAGTEAEAEVRTEAEARADTCTGPARSPRTEAEAEARVQADTRVRADTNALLAAVAFAMQPRVRPDLRPAAEAYLSSRLDDHTWRYFKRRRLASLALPGAVPARLAFLRRSPALRRVARRARALKALRAPLA